MSLNREHLAKLDGLEVRMPVGMPPHTQRLMASLGVRVVFDESLQPDYVNPVTGRRRGHGGKGLSG